MQKEISINLPERTPCNSVIKSSSGKSLFVPSLSKIIDSKVT